MSSIKEETPPEKTIELNAIRVDLEREDLKLGEQTTAETNSPDIEIINYEEALERAGGFGAYQVLLFGALSIFNAYGDQIIFNFVYLTSPQKQLCKYPGEENF